MPNYNGHAPGHVRNTFMDAVDAFVGWESGEPEPKVEFEVKFDTRQISISEACGLVWNCSDILPVNVFRDLEDAGLEMKKQTYAAAAHAMLESIKSSHEGVAA